MRGNCLADGVFKWLICIVSNLKEFHRLNYKPHAKYSHLRCLVLLGSVSEYSEVTLRAHTVVAQAHTRRNKVVLKGSTKYPWFLECCIAV